MHLPHISEEQLEQAALITAHTIHHRPVGYRFEPMAAPGAVTRRILGLFASAPAFELRHHSNQGGMVPLQTDLAILAEVEEDFMQAEIKASSWADCQVPYAELLRRNQPLCLAVFFMEDAGLELYTPVTLPVQFCLRVLMNQAQQLVEQP